MVTDRALIQYDIPACRRLWQERFEDSDAFCDWYFSERFAPALSAGVFLSNNGMEQLISMAHGRLLPLSIAGKPRLSLMVGGVATRKDAERRGYMRLAMQRIREIAAASGAELLVLSPIDPAIYTGLGYIVCAESLRVRTVGGSPLPMVSEPDAKSLLGCYTRCAMRYDFAPCRTPEAMRSRIRELRSDGAELVVLTSAERMLGYAFFNRAENRAEEVFAEDTDAYLRLIRGMPAGLDAMLPPDLPLNGKRHAQLMALSAGSNHFAVVSGRTAYCPEEF